MQIENLFTKNLFRAINGVVKVDQQDDPIVWQELDEYVVTRELDKHFHHFFSTYLAAMDNSQDPVLCSRMGVWVSGFFGSGKSHFIKILSYLLSNREARNLETSAKQRASDFFDVKIDDPMLLADIKRAVSKNTDVILYNIDSKADNKEGRDAILSVFMRVFNEMQGFSGDAPHIAEIERYLAERDLLDRFHQEFKEISGEEWLKERDAYLLWRDEVIGALARVLGKSVEAAAEWFDKAEKNYSLTVERFAKQVKEYLERKGPDHRIVFIADEVGQFIGTDTHLMLNLQTITEDLGRMCGGRAWVVVTSQEDIDAVVGEVRGTKANDFSKIQGRFNTRLSLSSTNTDEVIQVRLLEKTDEARRELEELFEQKGEILKNQLSFVNSSGALKNYKDKHDFVNTYPFAPYHFQLVQKIFETIRKAGATGLHLSRGERSMLDAFQSATRNIAKEEAGALVPLYEFYPSIESFLDTSVKRTIEQAADNPHLEPFDIELLRVLFLIRYVDIIKSNVDNLVTLCIDKVDADRLALKNQIEESLQRLEKEILINRNGDLYFFLTNEERDVSREIKNVDISSHDEIKKLAELIYDDLLKGESKHRYQENKKDYGFNRLCDKFVHGKADQSLTIEFLSPLSDDYTLFNSAKCIGYSAEEGGRILIKLADSTELGRELRAYLQTEKYIRLKNDAAAPDSLKKILNERANENRERRERLGKLLDKLILEADYYAIGQQLQIKANNPRAAVSEAQSYLIKNRFTKLCYLDFLHDDPQKEIVAMLMADSIGQQNLKLNIAEKNGQALDEIRQYIELCSLKNQTILLNELINRFSDYPCGWPEWEIALLVTRLFVAGEISLMMEGATLRFKDAKDPLTKQTQWKQIKLLKHKAVETSDLKAANKLGQEIFSKLGPDSEEGLYTFLQQELRNWKEQLAEFKPLADTGNYPGKQEIDEGLELVRQLLNIQDSYEFFELFNKKKSDLKDLYDDLHDLNSFYNNQRATWERLRDTMGGLFKNNRQELEKDNGAKQALMRMDQILDAANPYGMLKETDGLIATVNAVNERVTIERRSYAVQMVDEKIEHVKKAMEAIKATADLSNKLLAPLQDIKRKLQTEPSIPAILYYQSEAMSALEAALDKIEECRLLEEKKSAAPAKQVKVVQPSKLTTKYYLESQEEIDHFLDLLKKELEEALRNNMRIQIK